MRITVGYGDPARGHARRLLRIAAAAAASGLSSESSSSWYSHAKIYMVCLISSLNGRGGGGAAFQIFSAGELSPSPSPSHELCRSRSESDSESDSESQTTREHRGMVSHGQRRNFTKLIMMGTIMMNRRVQWPLR